MLRRFVASLLLLSAVPPLASAQLTQIGSRAALTGGTFDWATINANNMSFTIGPSVSRSVASIGFATSRPGAQQNMVLFTEGTFMDGMLTRGERVLLGGRDPEPITFSFASSLLGFGLNIQPDACVAFTGRLEFFNGLTSLGAVSVNGINTGGSNGTAPFLGATSSVDFNRVVVTAPVGGDRGFLVNRFSINSTTVVPEPSSYMLLLGGFGALALIARRRRSS
jgi:hypothetical protein